MNLMAEKFATNNSIGQESVLSCALFLSYGFGSNVLNHFHFYFFSGFHLYKELRLEVEEDLNNFMKLFNELLESNMKKKQINK